MNLRETLVVAVRGLRANRMRSALTMLGILIGVGAVILLVAVGTGSSTAVQKRIQSLGTNTLTISKQRAGGAFAVTGGQSARARAQSSATRSNNLTEADVTALENKNNNPDIALVAPVVTVTSTTASHDGTTYTPSQIIGTNTAYRTIHDYQLADGDYFSDVDVDTSSRVVVLGQTVVQNVFGFSNPIGQQIKLGSTQFTVAGVLKAKGTNGSQDQDDIVIAPYTTLQSTLTSKTSGYSQIVVQAASSSKMDAASEEITATLTTTHKLASATSADFQVLNQATLLETSNSTNKVFTVLLGAVAAISLLVGGIGVMNIMLVTVTERTREIGIRKAIGARKADIMGQFLTEAILLSVLGGLAGIAAGLIGSQFRIVGIDPVVEPYSVALAFGVAVAVGLFFGLYPANRAASLRPIEALRYE